MASTGSLSHALHTITRIKLNQLKKDQVDFEKIKNDLRVAADKASSWQQKVQILVQGLKDLPSIQPSDSAAQLLPGNIDAILEQAENDPSISQTILEGWIAKLNVVLDNCSMRFTYASLYGELVTEWIVSCKDTNSVDTDNMLVPKDSKESEQQLREWKDYVFKPLTTDTRGITRYLETIFGSSKQSRASIEALRAGVKAFENELKAPKQVNLKRLSWSIEGLLRSDLLTDQKRAMLADWSKDKSVLNDLADMMNLRLASKDILLRPQTVVAEQRRNLDGKYRVFQDEDLIDSLLLRYLGVKWSVHFHGALTELSAYNSWTAIPAVKPSPTTANEKREYFLNKKAFPQNIEAKIAEFFHNNFFLAQLLKDEAEVERSYEGDDKDDAANEGLKVRESPSELKQSLLHLLSTEIIMKTRLHGELAVVRTDFKSFGPSLSHSTLFTILNFFGVSDDWILFFKRSMEVPLRFTNDPTGEVRVRKRGTGLSSPLADVCGELLMYCLDVVVFQKTNGMRLWRLHDDFWFWGSESVCAIAWRTMKEFATLMGLDFNREKTGSMTVTGTARRSRKPDPPHLRTRNSDLPSGEIRWGFLALDCTGQVVIDDAMVDKHISGLQVQLSSCKSVFEWIQVYNAYAVRFYSSMFGKPANAFGRNHIKKALETFQGVQKAIFDKATLIDHGQRSVTEYLKAIIEKRFGTANIPDGFLYFPTALGGLDLRNPFTPLRQVYNQVLENPDSLMDVFFKREVEAYQKAKISFETEYREWMRTATPGERMKRRNLHYIPPSPEQFFSFEEYTADREQNSLELCRIYDELLHQPQARHSLYGQEDSNSTSGGVPGAGGVGFAAYVNQLESVHLTPYHQWIVQIYGAQMIEKFGSLQIVSPEILPTAMVNAFRAKRIKWQG
ncbi:MAG: hypothetical protein Q9195_002347 [Heterodermia aff. obscurata]